MDLLQLLETMGYSLSALGSESFPCAITKNNIPIEMCIRDRLLPVDKLLPFMYKIFHKVTLHIYCYKNKILKQI